MPYEYLTRMPERPRGPVFFTRYTVQKQLLEAPEPPEHVIIHEHDIWNPFTNAYDPADLWIYSHPSLAAILVTNPSMVPWGERYLPCGRAPGRCRRLPLRPHADRPGDRRAEARP